MKKSFVVNCIIITGLLVLCVMTLLAVYATAPEASVLILEETFSNLDKNKWSHEISKCTVDGNQFHYDRGDGENGFAADGILHIYSNLTNTEFKTKREASSKCSCLNCDSFLFSASLETKEIFYATAGKIEFRAKFRKSDWIRFQIGIVSNNTKSEEISGIFSKKEDKMRGNDFIQLFVIFKSANNQTVLKGVVLDNNFHIYEIEWNSDKTKLYIDHMKVDEESFLPIFQAKRFSNDTAGGALTIQPFFLSIKVEFNEKLLDNYLDSESPNKTIIEESEHFSEASVLDIDYIKLYKTGN